jgi:hypothetical protein
MVWVEVVSNSRGFWVPPQIGRWLADENDAFTDKKHGDPPQIGRWLADEDDASTDKKLGIHHKLGDGFQGDRKGRPYIL